MDGSVLGEPTLSRSSNVDCVVVLLPRRMIYLDDDMESRYAVAALLINRAGGIAPGVTPILFST